MTKVRVSAQVESFVKSLAPEPRRALRTGIKSLASQQGYIKHLEGDLAGWSRRRVHAYRVVFKEIWRSSPAPSATHEMCRQSASRPATKGKMKPLNSIVSSGRP